MSHSYKRLQQNIGTLLINNGLSALLSFVLSVLIGRVLGQDGLGIYAAALAWVYPLSLVAEFGIGTLITREVARDASQNFLREASIARLFLGGGLTLLLMLIAPLLSNDSLLVRGLQISAPLIVIVPFVGTFTAIFRAHQIMWPVAWLNLGMLIAQVLLTALVFLAGLGVLVALAVNTLTSAAQLLAAWVIYRTRFSVGAIRESPAFVKTVTLLRHAAPFALAAILAAIQSRISIIILETLTNPGEVGYYAAANRFAEAARMIPNALFGSLLPVLSAQQIENRLFSRVMVGLTFYALVLFGGTALFAPFIIDLTFGEDFAPSVPTLVILMASLLPSLLRSARTLYWYAQGHESFVNWVTLWTLPVQILLSLWLIPQYGASGVALAMLLTESVALGLLMRNVQTN